MKLLYLLRQLKNFTFATTTSSFISLKTSYSHLALPSCIIDAYIMFLESLYLKNYAIYIYFTKKSFQNIYLLNMTFKEKTSTNKRIKFYM